MTRLSLILLTAYLCLTPSAVRAGGVLCANRCHAALDFQACCRECEEACPNCVGCSSATSVVCPSHPIYQQCAGLKEGAACTTYGPHGGKMAGECALLPEGGACGCRPVFTTRS